MRKKKTEKEKNNMRALEVPRLLQPKLFHLEMEGNEELIIDGVCSVLDYGEHAVKLHTETVNLLIQGDNLVLESYGNGEAVIEGILLCISIET